MASTAALMASLAAARSALEPARAAQRERERVGRSFAIACARADRWEQADIEAHRRAGQLAAEPE